VRCFGKQWEEKFHIPCFFLILPHFLTHIQHPKAHHGSTARPSDRTLFCRPGTCGDPLARFRPTGCLVRSRSGLRSISWSRYSAPARQGIPRVPCAPHLPPLRLNGGIMRSACRCTPTPKSLSHPHCQHWHVLGGYLAGTLCPHQRKREPRDPPYKELHRAPLWPRTC
jgi:hypothetical protein